MSERKVLLIDILKQILNNSGRQNQLAADFALTAVDMTLELPHKIQV